MNGNGTGVHFLLAQTRFTGGFAVVWEDIVSPYNVVGISLNTIGGPTGFSISDMLIAYSVQAGVSYCSHFLGFELNEVFFFFFSFSPSNAPISHKNIANRIHPRYNFQWLR